MYWECSDIINTEFLSYRAHCKKWQYKCTTNRALNSKTVVLCCVLEDIQNEGQLRWHVFKVRLSMRKYSKKMSWVFWYREQAIVQAQTSMLRKPAQPWFIHLANWENWGKRYQAEITTKQESTMSNHHKNNQKNPFRLGGDITIVSGRRMQQFYFSTSCWKVTLGMKNVQVFMADKKGRKFDVREK